MTNTRNAGRKPLCNELKKRKVTHTLSPEVIKALQEHIYPASQIVEYAVRQYLKM